MVRLSSAAAAGAALLIATSAGAQSINTPVTPPPRWDVVASIGASHVASRDIGADWDGTDAAWETRFDLGRHLTTHLKAEVGVSLPAHWDLYTESRFPVVGLPVYYSYANQRVSLTTVSPSITYQFGENAFVHPFVAGGARVSIVDTHWTRDARVASYSGRTFQVPAIDQRDTTVLVRPFVAAGFKSYFNERVFVRTEGLLAAGPHGASGAYRLGFGVDF